MEKRASLRKLARTEKNEKNLLAVFATVRILNLLLSVLDLCGYICTCMYVSMLPLVSLY
jgi:hypothetical protein